MKRRLWGTVLVMLLLAGVTPGWSQQQYLYLPQSVAAGAAVEHKVEHKDEHKDGILVQDMAIRKGDTLSGISRTFSGHASYYPQILLFNDIKNPDRIYAGDHLRVPVTRSGVASRATGLTKPAAKAEKKRDRRHKVAAPARTHAGYASQQANTQTNGAAAANPVAAAEQRLFEHAVKVYRRNDCRRALKLFDRFLADYPDSALAANASLYKAQCYLKQSGR